MNRILQKRKIVNMTIGFKKPRGIDRAFLPNTTDYYILFSDIGFPPMLQALHLPVKSMKMPPKPTRMYTSLSSHSMDPKIALTRLNSKAPTSPQLIAPANTRTNAIQCPTHIFPFIEGRLKITTKLSITHLKKMIQ